MSYGAPVISSEEIIAGLQKKVEQLEANERCLIKEWNESQTLMVAQIARLQAQVVQFKSGHKEYE